MGLGGCTQHASILLLVLYSGADSLYVSFLEALPAPPLYSALTLIGMDEWPDAAPPVPPPPNGVDEAALDPGASSHSDARTMTTLSNDDHRAAFSVRLLLLGKLRTRQCVS